MRRFQHLLNVLASVTVILAVADAASAQTAQPPAPVPAGALENTQLFFGPTARMLPKGKGYVKGLGVSVPFFQGGVTDRFSIGMGTPIFAPGQLIMVTPKLQIQRSAAHSTAIGTLHLLGLGTDIGLAYAVHTFEGENGAAHVAILKPYGGHVGWKAAGIMLAAEGRVSRTVTFVTENYVLGHTPIVSGGVRISGVRGSVDLGWITPLGWGFIGAPVINVGWKF